MIYNKNSLWNKTIHTHIKTQILFNSLKTFSIQSKNIKKFHLLGDDQPGCPIDMVGSCSHSRAHALFAESIISPRFVATRCDTLQQAVNQACSGARDVAMGGEPGNIGLRGIFHLRTNRNSPFARG